MIIVPIDSNELKIVERVTKNCGELSISLISSNPAVLLSYLLYT